MALWKTLGAVVRQSGQALDSIGSALQGRYAVKDTLSMLRTVQPFAGKEPVIGSTFVAPNASIIGDVVLGKNSSVWYGAVLRGDVNSIRVGENTNLQDGVIVHVAKNNAAKKPAPTVIGNDVTVGHGATLHACTVEDGVLIGMGAVLLDGVTVQKGAIVGAGALVSPNTTVPSGQIWAGTPARQLRPLDQGEAEFIIHSARNYVQLAEMHAQENQKTMEEIEVDKAHRLDRAYRDPDYDSHLGVERDVVTRQVTNVADHT